MAALIATAFSLTRLIEVHALADHEHNTYLLQISLYRVLLEEAGIPTGGGAIVHRPPGSSPAQVYKAIDYRSRLRGVIF